MAKQIKTQKNSNHGVKKPESQGSSAKIKGDAMKNATISDLEDINVKRTQQQRL